MNELLEDRANDERVKQMIREHRRMEEEQQ